MYNDEYGNVGGKIIISICIVGVMALALVIIVSGFTLVTTQGEHTGFVTATQKTGFIWQTMDAYVKTNTQSSQEDKYCVADPVVFQQLKDAQESKENITIQFGHGHWVPMWQCDGGAVDVITGVK